MFIQKARNIQRLGGVGVIVVDNVAHTSSTGAPMFAMSGDGSSDIVIPVVFLYGQEGSTLLEILREYPEMIIHLEPSNVYHEASQERNKNMIRISAEEAEEEQRRVEEDMKPFDSTHGSDEWLDKLTDGDEEVDVEMSSVPELSSILKGVAHVTELNAEENVQQGNKQLNGKFDLSSTSLKSLENVLNVVAGDLSQKYIDAITTDKNVKSKTFRIEKNLMENVLNQVIQKSIKAFKEVIDEKKYKVLEPVLGGVIKSMKNLNEAQEKLDRWLNELREDAMQTKGLSASPLRNSQAFLRYLVKGQT